MVLIIIQQNLSQVETDRNTTGRIQLELLTKLPLKFQVFGKFVTALVQKIKSLRDVTFVITPTNVLKFCCMMCLCSKIIWVSLDKWLMRFDFGVEISFRNMLKHV